MNIDLNLFGQIARKVISNPSTRTSKMNLGKEVFQCAGRTITALEQNPTTGSKWAALAQTGHQVVQFKDNMCYVAVAVDGKVEPY